MKREWRSVAAHLGSLLAPTIVLTTIALSAAGAAAEDLVVTGSSTIAPILNEIAKRYEETHPDVRINVQSGGSSKGIADVRSGAAEIGMVSRALKADEVDLTYHLLALDGIAVIVNDENPVDGISRDDLVATYTGKITNWQQLGGSAQDIVVISKAEGRATLEVFLDYTRIDPQRVNASMIVGENEEDIRAVAFSPYAISYVSIGSALYNRDAGVPIKLLVLDGIEPTLAAVKSRQYPMVRELALVTLGPQTKDASDFIDYAQSTVVEDIVASFNMISVTH